MAGGDHDACLTLEIAYQIGENGGRLQFGCDVSLNAVCGKYLGGFDHKEIRLDTAVVRNRNGSLAVLVDNIICETLSCLANNINIHSVCACADNASQTRSTEFKRGIKTLVDLAFISANALKFSD